MGSTSVARRAGSQAAPTATTNIIATAMEMLAGSAESNPKCKPASSRLLATPSGSPMAPPIKTSNNASRRMSPRM